MAYTHKPVDESLFTTAPCITRYPELIMTKDMCPFEAMLTFNAGVLKKDGEYVMLFRNDIGTWGGRVTDTNMGLAHSTDGIHFTVEDKPVFRLEGGDYLRAYDPRITWMDGHYIMCFAADTRHGLRGGIAVSDDLHKFEIVSMSAPDNRNMVIFPEKINGHYVRLERPMPVYSFGHDKFDMWCNDSPDLVYWGNPKLVMGTEHVPFCNDKIGPGAPPIKTDKGWLTIFHSVDVDESRGKNGWEAAWKKRYVIGVCLLDLNDPSKVIGMSKRPLMVPEGKLELEDGYRNNALFPCGMLLEEDNTVRIYYSACDMYVRMATAPLDDLLALCDSPL